MNNTSTIGFIQIEIQDFDQLYINKISQGIEKMFNVDSKELVGKSLQECSSHNSNFSSFLLKELENSYKSLISHSESFNFETSFIDTTLQQKYLCHLTLHQKNKQTSQLFDVTVINVSVQSKNMFILEEILEKTSRVVGKEFFDAVVMLFYDFFGVTASYIGFFTQNNTKNFLYSFAKNGRLSNEIEIDLAGTACELVLQKGEVTIESEIEKHIKPPIEPLSFKREAFIGQPITNHLGDSVGIIGIQHETKIQDTSLIRSIMRILAPRTYAEHSRLSAHELLVDKNRYYQYILENISSAIIATNDEGIIQNVTNSVTQLLHLPLHIILGNSIGTVFTLEKQLFEQSFFFKILIANINTPIVAKVVTKNPLISELIFETKEFQFESGKKEYIFTIKETTNTNVVAPEVKDLEYFVREAKILALRTILLELQQTQTKNPLENIDRCLQIVSKTLSVEYSGYWSTIEKGLKCERFYEVLESKFNSNLEGFTLHEPEYSDYLQYFRKLKEPSVIYDVYTNPVIKVFKNYFLQFGIEFMVEIPIWINGELKGMFCVEGKDSSRRFEEYEIAFLSAVSLIISQGLHQSISSNNSLKKEKLQEQLLFAFHSIQLPIIIINTKKLNILDVNESWANAFNYHKDAIIGFSLHEINFFRFCSLYEQSEIEAIFSSEIALKQQSLTFIDHRNNKFSFLITSTLFSVNDDSLALFCFQPFETAKSLPINNGSNEQLNSQILHNEVQTDSDEKIVDFSFESLYEQILITFTSLIETKNLSFSFFVEENIKSLIVSKSKEVQSILNELLKNAFDNTDKGFISFSLSHKTQNEGIDLLVVEVKDSGIGMSEELVNDIITSFSQINKHKDSGLTSVRDVVASLEGIISIDSLPNVGTTVIIEIPLVSIANFEEITYLVKTGSSVEYPETSMNITDKMILLQRNLLINSDTIEKLLSHFGALNYYTHSIQETKEVSEFIHFDCILLLLDSWNEDDISLLNAIQEQTINTTTPIIVITSSQNGNLPMLQTVAIEIIPFSSSTNELMETLEILFPIEEKEQVENLD
ncbi:MAG: PAS domain-containing protein [Candidatus Kapabacteria bacterium]|nr:PAS domain-containing protein [Candidatus Kapabacteria bacterium]